MTNHRSLRRRFACHCVTAVLVVAVVACERRETPRIAGGISRVNDVRQIDLQPGQVIPTAAMQNPFAQNAYALRDGERLYNWYNCSGCHFAGGGGIGPPLMDDDWIYGSDPQNIFATIMEGRPDGMPSYRGKLPPDDAWKIVAYVQSLSDDQEPPGRGEQKQEDTGEQRMEKVDAPTPSEAESESQQGSSDGGSR